MKYSQIEKSLPLYNELHLLESDLTSLKALESKITELGTFTIALRSSGSLSISYEGISNEFTKNLVASLIIYKEKNKKDLEDKLDLL